MAARSSAGKRWVEILRVLRDELPGEWSLRGGGLKTKLVREPKGLRSIELGEDGDLEAARTFTGHALARIEELTPERLAERAEISLKVLGGERLPSNYILEAPGWRVVNDSGDPVEAAEGCLEWVLRRHGEHGEVVPGIARSTNS